MTYLSNPPCFPAPFRAVSRIAIIAVWLTLLAAVRTAAFDDHLGWNFESGDDPLTAAARLDIGALLNDPMEAPEGLVSQRNGRFYFGNGREARFWGVGVNNLASTTESLRAQMQFLAKRGVNMVRFSPRTYGKNQNDLLEVNSAEFDKLQKGFAACRAAGMHAMIEPFWILTLEVKPGWNIEGYTDAWLKDNPDKNIPFGLQFFDPTLKAAYKSWLKEIFTRANPNAPGATPIGQDSALGLILLQGEDNLFFYTFNPANYPPAQQERIDRLFGDFLIAKYGSINAATAAWGSSTALSRDDPTGGLMTVQSAADMGSGFSVRNRRLPDQLEFITRLQADWYEEIIAMLRDEAGIVCPIIASNWQTANAAYLADLDHYVYTSAGVLAMNKFFGAAAATRATSWQVSGGDTYYSLPIVSRADTRFPFLFKHAHGFPTVITSTSWLLPMDYQAEAPFLSAAYAAMGGVDGLFFNFQESLTWEGTRTNLAVTIPPMVGQFPLAALMYRRGDVAQAPVVVREGRQLESLYHASKQRLDLTNSSHGKTYEPPTAEGTNAWDPSIAYVGSVEVDFETDEDYIDSTAFTLIDRTGTGIRSVTGQLAIDETKGLMTFNTPLAQGATGFLNGAGFITLSNAMLRLRNNFGSLGLISLDGRPLSQSTSILIQAIGDSHPTGFTTETIPLSFEGKSVDGQRIMTVGARPWLAESIEGRVDLLGTLRPIKAEALDTNGYAVSDLTGSLLQTANGWRLNLPKTNAYVLLTLEAPADEQPVVTTRGLALADAGKSYEMRLTAAGGNEPLVWSILEPLPEGLTLESNGLLQGTPLWGGQQTLTVKVQDVDGDADSRPLHLTVLGQDKPVSIWPGLAGNKWFAETGFLYDGFYPFVYFYSLSDWLYVWPEGASQNGFYAYAFGLNDWLYLTRQLPLWFFSFREQQWKPL